MKKHFSFEKFRIITKKNNLNFIDVFNNDKKIHIIIYLFNINKNNKNDLILSLFSFYSI